MNSLEGKVAIVTGAARGLGRAYALRLAALGADVVIADRDLQGAAEFGEILSAGSVKEEVEALGRRSIEFQGELSQRAAANEMVARTLQAFGRVDILVNNAGGMTTPMERSYPSAATDDDVQVTLDMNFHSMLNCCQAAIPVMRAQQSGVIINVSSTAARNIAQAGLIAVYGAAKAAVTHYTRSLAAEVGADGIRANCIAPGIILTARLVARAKAAGKDGIDTTARAAMPPLGRLGNVEDCANVVEFLATDLSRYVTGQCISVCGGATLSAA